MFINVVCMVSHVGHCGRPSKIGCKAFSLGFAIRRSSVTSASTVLMKSRAEDKLQSRSEWESVTDAVTVLTLASRNLVQGQTIMKS